MRSFILSLAALAALLSVAPFAADAQGVRLYGNWCGPGNGLNSARPVDPLDAACMRHDICYAATGTVACECDVGFMRELRAMVYPNPDVEDAARAMYDALAMTPCDDPTGWALKQSMMWNDIATDALSGRATPFEVPARWLELLSKSSPEY